MRWYERINDLYLVVTALADSGRFNTADDVIELLGDPKRFSREADHIDGAHEGDNYDGLCWLCRHEQESVDVAAPIIADAGEPVTTELPNVPMVQSAG